MSTSITTDIPLAQQIISICKAQNIKHIVISPGSRNAPLIIGFTNDFFFKCYSIVDERCAAFFALGIAQQAKEPVALVCSSGSALLNYYPAIAEAFYSDIPLVVLSADRPKEHIDIGDGQTIRQEHVYTNHILFEANLKNALIYNESLKSVNYNLVTKALEVAAEENGPVHINIPLYEPLYNTIKKTKTKVGSANTVIKNIKNFRLEKRFKEQWSKSSKKMILIGVLQPNSIEETILDNLLKDPSITVLTETTSNLYHKKAIPGIDKVILKRTEEELAALKPDLLLTFGGMVVSKKVKAFLRVHQPKKHWHVDVKKAYDTFFCLSKHFKISPNTLLKELVVCSNYDSNYQKKWLTLYKKQCIAHVEYMKEIPFSDLQVFESIIKQLPKNTHLQLSNSSTIRYSQLFEIPKEVEVFCNRGTSGIDGSTSTAIGAALIQKKPSVFITGDLSFLYDSNALWNNYIPSNFKIIIINNTGGGIFRILPGNKSAKYFSAFLETNHEYSAENFAKMFQFEYRVSTTRIELEKHLIDFFEKSSKIILEISTPRVVNDEVLRNYFS